MNFSADMGYFIFEDFHKRLKKLIFENQSDIQKMIIITKRKSKNYLDHFLSV